MAQRGVVVLLYTFSNFSTRWGGGWSTAFPSHFTPGKETQYPLDRRLGGPQSQSAVVQKISPPPGFSPQNIHSYISHNIDCSPHTHNK